MELPQMLENEYKPEDKSQVKQNVQYMEKILNKMENSIKKDDAQSASDFAKLPKPAQMLSQLKGRVVNEMFWMESLKINLTWMRVQYPRI